MIRDESEKERVLLYFLFWNEMAKKPDKSMVIVEKSLLPEYHLI